MRILIADDDRVSLKIAEATLGHAGYETYVATNGRQAWDLLCEHGIHLVVADWMMPEVDGLELLRLIRSSRESRYTYVILLTSKTEIQDVVEGLRAGADDYVTKPFNQEELKFRVRAGERVIRLEEELASRNEQLKLMAMVDGLTGIGNRRAFDDAYRGLYQHSRRHEHPFGVVMADIDHFKRYNDQLGHEAGDRALRAVAQSLERSGRAADMQFRYGGEEFVVLLPETGPAGCLVVAERLRHAVERAGIPHPENPPRDVITVSLGVAAWYPASEVGADTLLRHADEALYVAKREGRSQTIMNRSSLEIRSRRAAA
jgi:diguanylate cyclase (GGDEF)-like protein